MSYSITSMRHYIIFEGKMYPFGKVRCMKIINRFNFIITHIIVCTRFPDILSLLVFSLLLQITFNIDFNINFCLINIFSHLRGRHSLFFQLCLSNGQCKIKMCLNKHLKQNVAFFNYSTFVVVYLSVTIVII